MPKDTFSIQTPATFRNQARELEKIAARFEAVAATMEAESIEEIEVKGESERSRVFKGAFAFAQNAEDAIRDVQSARGEHGQPAERQAKKSVRRSGKQ